jgi:transcription elongation factor GreB
MSRAFVDEDSGSDEADDLAEIPLPLPAGAKNYMTPEGAARLSAELREFAERELPRAQAALAASEAGDQAAAIRRVSELERRLSYLRRMEALLEAVPDPASTDRVVFGLEVAVAEEGGERAYRIVGADESDPEAGLLSWASPVARALIGKRVGETAVAVLPKGERRMRVLAIRRAAPREEAP